jgi:hypothetical protein
VADDELKVDSPKRRVAGTNFQDGSEKDPFVPAVTEVQTTPRSVAIVSSGVAPVLVDVE